MTKLFYQLTPVNPHYLLMMVHVAEVAEKNTQKATISHNELPVSEFWEDEQV